MRAVVLVGGFGTRLRPLTFDTPKPMLPVAGKPMIERTIRLLAAHGVDEVVLSLGFASDAFAAALGDTCAGVRLRYEVEPEPLVANSDVMTDLDLSALVAFHEASGAEGTIALTPVDDPSHFGVVPTDDDGRVTAFVEKPAPGTEPTNLINAGFYVLEPSVLARVEPDVKVSIERVTFPAMVADGSLFALSDESYWIDVGTPERYLTANLDLLEVPDDRGWVAVDAVIDPSATVVDSVILDGAVVEAGARVERSIVGRRAVIGAGAVVAGVSVIGHDARVPDGAELRGQKLPDPDA
jgi:mannose-1-phosphate guanylyltransferase